MHTPETVVAAVYLAIAAFHAFQPEQECYQEGLPYIMHYDGMEILFPTPSVLEGGPKHISISNLRCAMHSVHVHGPDGWLRGSQIGQVCLSCALNAASCLSLLVPMTCNKRLTYAT